MCGTIQEYNGRDPPIRWNGMIPTSLHRCIPLLANAERALRCINLVGHREGTVTAVCKALIINFKYKFAPLQPMRLTVTLSSLPKPM